MTASNEIPESIAQAQADLLGWLRAHQMYSHIEKLEPAFAKCLAYVNAPAGSTDYESADVVLTRRQQNPAARRISGEIARLQDITESIGDEIQRKSAVAIIDEDTTSPLQNLATGPTTLAALATQKLQTELAALGVASTDQGRAR